MTPRTLRRLAFALALLVQTAMMLTYGAVTDGCFCSVTGAPTPPVPPDVALRLIETAVLPTAWMEPGMGLPVLFVLNLDAWFIGVLALLHGMVLALRVRIRGACRGAERDARWVWLADRERVPAWRMLLLACVFVSVGMSAGAMARERWLAEAEQVLAASIAAASAGQPMPAGVDFWMWEWRGHDMVDAKPEARYTLDPDRPRYETHFLDRFVVPYRYAGTLRFGSGQRYEFSVYRAEKGPAIHESDEEGWGIHIEPARSR